MDLRVAAYAVVLDPDDRLLLAHWNEGRRAAWTMPGGGLEPGEDPEHAARPEEILRRRRVVAPGEQLQPVEAFPGLEREEIGCREGVGHRR